MGLESECFERGSCPLVSNDLLMQSYCLNHQERPATGRCSGCMKPICPDCVYSTGSGVFCGATCHENAQASEERIAEMKARDAAQRGPNLIRKLMSVVLWLIAIGGVVAAWPYMPTWLTAPVEQILQKIGIGSG